MKYIEINDYKDVEKLMKEFCYFHDSCIKEIAYTSGSYVNNDKTMRPINDERRVSIILQSQISEHRTIELCFELIEKLNLQPKGEGFESVIYGASLVANDELFYWSDWEGLNIKNISEESGTWISAKKVKWCPLL
ncbi:MAG: hypothetical protein FWD05_02460 [Oscillospiraceae bacterium]|nr:hypothetical protein [Oscillospiraceae bacterium]